MESLVEECGYLAKVWDLWWQQQLDSDCQLWSLSITSWGRIGKLLGAVGFVALIVEIIGPSKLKKWGETLQKGPAKEQRLKAQQRINKAHYEANPHLGFLAYLNPLTPIEGRDVSLSQLVTFLITSWSPLFALGLMGIGASWVAYKWWSEWGLWNATLWQAPLFLIGMLVLMTLVILGLLCWIITTPILLPLGFALLGIGSAYILSLISDALSHDRLGPFIKAATGIALLVGLFLDLLSS
jgi:hypothetical protein